MRRLSAPASPNCWAPCAAPAAAGAGEAAGDLGQLRVDAAGVEGHGLQAPGAGEPGLVAALGRLEAKLDKQLADKSAEISALENLLHDNREQSERRHTALLQSLTAYFSRLDAIESAFLPDRKEHPDFAGHRDDHATRKATAEWVSSVRDDAVRNIVKVSALATALWAFYALWDAFLKGPK